MKKLDRRWRKMSAASRRVHRRAELSRYAGLVTLPWGEGDRGQAEKGYQRSASRFSTRIIMTLEKVKDRIIEYLAVQFAEQVDLKGPILCLVGPRRVSARPRSASRSPSAMGRKFARASLGGVRDEAEIRGHRRTYVGRDARAASSRASSARLQQPGVHARRDRQARQRLPRRPLLGAARGARPGAERNDFLATITSTCRSTCQQGPVHLRRRTTLIDTIPPALQATAWRCSSCPGYTEEEKLEIAKRKHLIPKRQTRGRTG